MYLSYFDEAGDDGLANLQHSSQLFTLTSIYMEESVWRDNFDGLRNIRKEIQTRHSLKPSIELHTMKFLKGKGVYWDDGIGGCPWGAVERIEILDEYFQGVSELNLKIINVAIDKVNLVSRSDMLNYWDGVLDIALTYNINRIEMDLKGMEEDHGETNRFIVITDRGRVGPMASITRKRQIYNPTPSNYKKSYSFLIERIVEDPMPKDSKKSVFVQLADAITTILLLYVRKKFNAGKSWSNQIPGVLDMSKIEDWFDTLKPILNEKARPSAKYGVVYEPN